MRRAVVAGQGVFDGGRVLHRLRAAAMAASNWDPMLPTGHLRDELCRSAAGAEGYQVARVTAPAFENRPIVVDHEDDVGQGVEPGHGFPAKALTKSRRDGVVGPSSSLLERLAAGANKMRRRFPHWTVRSIPWQVAATCLLVSDLIW